LGKRETFALSGGEKKKMKPEPQKKRGRKKKRGGSRPTGGSIPVTGSGSEDPRKKKGNRAPARKKRGKPRESPDEKKKALTLP